MKGIQRIQALAVCVLIGAASASVFAADKKDDDHVSAVLDAELVKFLTAEIPNFKADSVAAGKPFEYPAGITNDDQYREHLQKFFHSLIHVRPAVEAQFKAGKFDDAANLQKGKTYIADIEAKKHENPFVKRLVAKFNAGTAKGAELELLVRFLHGLSKN